MGQKFLLSLLLSEKYLVPFTDFYPLILNVAKKKYSVACREFEK
jgi:hypothetical protein